MKTRFVILMLFVINSLSPAVVSGQNKERVLETGWYYISDTNTGIERKEKNEAGKTYHIIPEPIVTKEDIEELKLFVFTNNKGENVFYITMQFVPDKVEAWRLATKKSVGKQLGMIVSNELINVPKVNMEITGGRAGMSEKKEDAVLKYLKDFQTVKTLKPDATIFSPATLMKIAKGVDSSPDSVKKEFRKRWMKMEESWKSSSINLSSNPADYISTEEYKDLRNYILTTDSTVLYLFADKYMEAPTGLYVYFLKNIVRGKNPSYKKDMDAMSHRDKLAYFSDTDEIRLYLNYLLSLAGPRK